MHISPGGTAVQPETVRVFLQEYIGEIAFFLHWLLLLTALDSIIGTLQKKTDDSADGMRRG